MSSPRPANPPTSTLGKEVSRDVPVGGGLLRPVFYPAAALVLVFVALAAVFPAQFNDIISTVSGSVIDSLGWYYVLLVFAFVGFALVMAFSRWGDIRLGKDDEDPEFGLVPWFAMLFGAGMGIGLVFWGVAEPLNHYASPRPGLEGSPEQLGQAAMTQTFLHWGLHAWAIYIVVGLGVAYAIHRKGRPVSIRWALEPLLGDRVRGPLGHVIDVVAVIGTLFGVATSLGFGVSQVSAGLEYLGIASDSSELRALLVVAITLLATVSVVSGLSVGIKWLSNINLTLATVLLVTVIALGPTLFIFRDFVQNTGLYLQDFLSLSFRTLPFYGEAGETWLGGWTTFYWGWWISWSPFVGIFIARISRGRTIREFVLGVLMVPTMLTFLWFSALGGSALYRQIMGSGGLIGEEGSVDTVGALFQLLNDMPGAKILSGLFMLLIVIFFVTSSDSGSLVVDMLASGGDPNPPRWSRVFWSVTEGLIALVLLWAGGEASGLAALQTMAILLAAPFTVVMIGIVLATIRAARHETRERDELERRVLLRELVQEQREAEEAGAAVPPLAP